MKPTVVYDRDCGFCRWSLGKLIAWDRSAVLDFVALQHARASELLAAVSPEDRMRSAHLVLPDGSVRSGGAAVPDLVALLPAGRSLAAAARRAPSLIDRAYRLVADNRDRLGPLVPAAAKARADARIAERSDAADPQPRNC